MAALDFLFVNKNASSTTLSRSEGEATMAIYRHVQKRVRDPKPCGVTSSTDIRIPKSRNSKKKAEKTTEDELTGSTRADAKVQTGTQELSKSGSAESQLGYRKTRSLCNTATSRPKYKSGENSLENGLSNLCRSIIPTNNAIDPFGSTPVPLTHDVQRLLLYFESMFFSQTSIQSSQVGFISAARNVVQDCIFDEVHVKCLLSSIASRREMIDCQVVVGGAAWYIHQATLSLQNRLKKSPIIDLKLMYAMMKLYIAEAYQCNAEGALVHLRGAQAAYNQIGTWNEFDTNYTPTLCASGEPYFLRHVWTQPIVFPTLADPGIASSCFSFHMMQTYVSTNTLSTDKGRLLINFLSRYEERSNHAGTMRQIVADLLEYSTIRHNMLQRENLGLEVPILVSQWAHLRRFALIFRLMSISIVGDDLLHMLRVAIVLWLQFNANFAGFNKNVQIVAGHLQEVVSSIPSERLLRFSEIMIWISLLGISVGDDKTKSWFEKRMSYLSRVVDFEGTWGLEQWQAYLVRISQECLFCELLQMQGVVDIAGTIFLARSSESTDLSLWLQ